MLALGIGANPAIFSLISSVLFHSSGIAQPDRVVAVRVKSDNLGMPSIGTSVMDYKEARDAKDTFSAAATLFYDSFNYVHGDSPVRLVSATVTHESFDVFGVRPVTGRVFTEQEDVKGANFVAVLAYSTWDRYFGKDPSIVGRTILLNQQPYRVIGIMPRSSSVPSRAEVWVPLASEYQGLHPGQPLPPGLAHRPALCNKEDSGIYEHLR